MCLDLLPEELLNQVVLPWAGSIECQTCRCPLRLDSTFFKKKQRDNELKSYCALKKPKTPEDNNDILLMFSVLSSHLIHSTNTTPKHAVRACYVKGKLKGTSLEDIVKHKVCFVKSWEDVLQLDHVYCRSCALEYCWVADWDNQILLKTKTHEREEKLRQEQMKLNLKLQHKEEQRLRNSIDSFKDKSKSKKKQQQR
mmetsp:Transcript_17310/g.26216  ORF Transcript_17310/g.26216 Transcript_17310/m.26216 type:complete len:197 (+) Transcript_17310:303-893(+)